MNPIYSVLPFKTGWYGFGLRGYRSCRGTYERYPDDAIPPLPHEQFTGQLQWLAPLHPEIDAEMQGYRFADEEQAEPSSQWVDNLKSLVASTKHFGLSLPESFFRLMSSPALRARIPSCTDCHFTLSRLAPCPGDREKGYVLRFLHDQQDCLIWHLYLSPEGKECVLASGTYLDSVHSDPQGFEQITEQEAIAQTWVCAPSFEAFLYRFWIENVIWFNLHKHKPMTEEQRQYLAFYGEEQQGGDMW